MNKFLSKRRMITFGLAIMGIVGSYGQAVNNEFTVEGDETHLVYHIIKYSNTAKGDNQVSIVGTAECPETLTIPQEVTDDKNNTYKVVAIFRMSNAQAVKYLTIPEGVTEIQDGAFSRLSNLTSVSLPASLNKIAAGAFGYCTSLASITIASDNQYFSVDAQSALYDKAQSILYFCPTSVAVGDYTVASTVTEILASAVSCSQDSKDGTVQGLHKVILPSGLQKISPMAFVECKNLKEYSIDESNSLYATPDGLLCNKAKMSLIAFPEAGSTSTEISNDNGRTVKLPSSITEVGQQAFYLNTTINKIDLNQVVTIGEQVFFRCPYLTTVDVPATTTSISSNAFEEAGKLQAINVSVENSSYKSQDGVLFSKDGKTLLTYPVSNYDLTQKPVYEIPDGTEEIAVSAFGGSNVNLIEVKMPSSVTTMGEKAFASSNIKKITLSPNLKTISDRAFWLSGIEEITIPAGVESVGLSAFYNCPELAKVTIEDGSKLKTIANSAFANCAKMEEFNFVGTCELETIEQFAFGNSTFKSFTLPTSVKTIGQQAFYGCSQMLSFDYGDNTNFKTLSANAFQNCSSLESITLPSSVTTIAGQAFNNCAKLKTVYIPAATTYVDPTAFWFCNSLTNIEVDPTNAKYQTIDGMLCEDDKKTLSIFPAGKANDKITLLSPSFTKIGKHAFYSCKKLTNVTIPKHVEYIGEEAFRMCDNLKTIAFLSDNPIIKEHIGAQAFLPQVGEDGGILDNLENIFVREENIDKYKVHETWKAYAGKMKTSFTVDKIDYFPMSENSVNVLKTTSDAYTLVVPAEVTNPTDNHTYTVDMIGDYAFENAPSTLKEVVLEGDIIYIGSWAFNTNARPTSTDDNLVATVASASSNIENVFFTAANQTSTELSTKRFGLGADYAEFTDNQNIYVRKSVKENATDTWNGYKDRLEYKIPLPEIKTTYSTFSREFDVDMSEDNWNDESNSPNVIAFTSGYYHAATTKREDGQAVTNYLVHMESVNNGAEQGDGTWIPKNTGVLLKATTADGASPKDFYYQIADKDEAFVLPDDNLMQAVTVKAQNLAYSTDNDFYHFIMSRGSFHRLLATSYDMLVHKSYLKLDKTDYEKVHPAEKTLAKMSFVFDDKGTTGITVVDAENCKDNDGAFYTLEGMKVSKPSKGIYIHNGKKYVVK